MQIFIFSSGGGVHQLLVPYDILTDNERKRYRRLTHELIKYLQYNGYRLTVRTGSNSTNTNTNKGNGGTSNVRHHDNRSKFYSKANKNVVSPKTNFSLFPVCTNY